MTDTSTTHLKPGSMAILVIDIQQGMFGKSTPVYQADRLLQNVNTLLDQAHAAGIAVFFVQHCDSRSLVQGTPDWQLHPDLHQYETDSLVNKHHGSAFEDTNLDAQLKAKSITSLVVAGLVTHGCVKNTCMGALPLGYRVVLVADGHSSFSKQAPELIEEWNQRLAEQAVEVVPAAEIGFG